MLKSKPLRVQWDEAIDKKAEEGRCRACLALPGWLMDGTLIVLECAHTVGREYDPVEVGPRGGKTRVVPREATIPLCRDCHRAYDENRLDIIPYLFKPEEDYAQSVLGLVGAYKKLSGGICVCGR
jgi:hypothetical protein